MSSAATHGRTPVCGPLQRGVRRHCVVDPPGSGKWWLIVDPLVAGRTWLATVREGDEGQALLEGGRELPGCWCATRVEECGHCADGEKKWLALRTLAVNLEPVWTNACAAKVRLMVPEPSSHSGRTDLEAGDEESPNSPVVCEERLYVAPANRAIGQAGSCAN